MDKDDQARVLRATTIPEKYRAFETSGLALTVPDETAAQEFPLEKAPGGKPEDVAVR